MPVGNCTSQIVDRAAVGVHAAFGLAVLVEDAVLGRAAVYDHVADLLLGSADLLHPVEGGLLVMQLVAGNGGRQSLGISRRLVHHLLAGLHRLGWTSQLQQ